MPDPATRRTATDLDATDRPRVAVVFTGGTISMGFDPVAGGNVPSLDGAAILARTSGLEAIARVESVDRGLTPASHFTLSDLAAIHGAVGAALVDPGIAGVVVVQGTDTIEETAIAWDLWHDDARPVAVTGAMRAPHEPGYEGATNLRDAVTVAAGGIADLGVVVVLDGTIEAADDVQKTHTTAFDTFRSPNRGSLGTVAEGRVVLRQGRGPRRQIPSGSAVAAAADRQSRDPVVHLITAGIGSDGALLDAAVLAGAEGIVVAATGSGNTAAGLLHAATRAIAAGVPVVHASRCPAGAVGSGYAFPGGSATWARAGAIQAGTLCAIKARIALMAGLRAGLSGSALTELLADPLP